MKNYKTILFDLDGTLTDSSPGIINSIIYSMKKFGVTIEDTVPLRRFLGPPLHESFMDVFGFDSEKAMKAVEYYREYYTVKGIEENSVYEGIEDLLASLKLEGKRLVVATSKPQPFAEKIINDFGLNKYFDFVAGSNLDGTRSKKVQVIKYALKSCGIGDISQAVMIGDRMHDVAGAKEAGIDCIGVEYGYGDYNELESAGADYIVKTAEDLKALLCK